MSRSNSNVVELEEVKNASLSSRECVGWDSEELNKHLKFLECSVCWEIVLPPIPFCVEGHCICRSCKVRQLPSKSCPTCRAKFSSARNLFAEQFLEQCKFLCKNGCSKEPLTVKQLVLHEAETCEFRPILCRECDETIEPSEFLKHLETKDELERLDASDCITSFEVDLTDYVFGAAYKDLSRTEWKPSQPLWLFCYESNFFCTLEFNGTCWWIWVYCLEASAPTDYECIIVVPDKKQGTEYSFQGKIHPIRSEANEVFESGECLTLPDSVLLTLVDQGAVDVRLIILSIKPQNSKSLTK